MLFRSNAIHQNMHTLVDGVFACGNAVQVSDLADYVSESGDDHYENLENVEIVITQLELLSALENADNAHLSVYLMPKDPENVVSSGLWVPDLVVTPAFTPTPTQTPTPDPFLTGTPYESTPQPVPTMAPAGE